MIPSLIYFHKRTLRHVTVHTLRAAAGRWVMMMRFCFEIRSSMALSTHRISFGDELVAVGVMTIGTNYAFLKHTALFKRAHHENLLPDLSIREIQWFVK